MYYTEIAELINENIKKLNFDLLSPQNLYAPIKYSLEGGGKRVRPVLCLMANQMFDGNIEDIIEPALGIEIFHNFTLLHDDIMDNSDLRHGKPAVHKQWNNNIAILSGDAMSIMAYQFIAKAKNNAVEILKTFSETALQICEGQQYDMDFEVTLDVSQDNYLKMITLKTAVLLAASLKIGALAANADAQNCENIYNVGINLGLAFQLQDDLLDSYGDTSKFQKNLGGDIVSNKKTYLLINALSKSDAETKKELLYWLDTKNFDKDTKINAVKNIYDKLNIPYDCLKLINDCCLKAELYLKLLNVEDAKKRILKDFIESLKDRKY